MKVVGMTARAAAFVALGFAAGCASGAARPSPFPGAAVPASRSLALAARRQAVITTALAQRGTPYRLGGDDPRGFDCSGLVRFVFQQLRVDLPRTVTELYEASPAVAKDQIEPGDLVFFALEARNRNASHVGIVVAPGEFLHAPATGRTVRTERFDTRYWTSRFKGARRPLALPPGGASGLP